MAKRNIAHCQAGTADQEPAVFAVPTTNYTDPERWQLEVDRIFKRLPLMVALGGELPEPGSYKAMEVVGVPILITRVGAGEIEAFVNMCSHRGAIVAPEGLGNSRRFSCPYHGWTYDGGGRLVGVTNRSDFGVVDIECLGLTRLPAAERAGMIFVGLTPGADLHIDSFLAGYDEVLEHFEYGTWHLASRREIVGPNWKIAYDGYLDYYHLPILHKDSFGPDIGNKAIYDTWGPHQRVTRPDPTLLDLSDTPEDEWDLGAIVGGVWTLFPNISMAMYRGESVLVSQLFPGPTPDRSITVQSYFLAETPDADAAAKAAEHADFLEKVVRDEDYSTGLGIQKAASTGAKSTFVFGQNEGGGHRFH
ncbi:MAG: aromatic ring-hydroxylating dioxygenase subunit alpha, partial [Actinomycetota bacterium]|nr:aromatic ring-hydroxylating dioxygenase subunit alpha [Actinomycetota bacterium]